MKVLKLILTIILVAVLVGAGLYIFADINVFDYLNFEDNQVDAAVYYTDGDWWASVENNYNSDSELLQLSTYPFSSNVFILASDVDKPLFDFPGYEYSHLELVGWEFGNSFEGHVYYLDLDSVNPDTAQFIQVYVPTGSTEFFRSVTIDPDGGTWQTGSIDMLPRTFLVPRGTPLNETIIMDIQLAKSTYRLNGFCLNGNNNGSKIDLSAPVNTDVLMYAYWEFDTVEVTFLDYDNSVLKVQSVLRGYAATPPAAPNHENIGLIFDGWNKDYSVITETNKTFKAQYRTMPKVQFLDSFDVVIKTQYVHVGADAAPPMPPANNGLEFLGWSHSYKNVQADVITKATYKPTDVPGVIMTLKDDKDNLIKVDAFGQLWDVNDNPLIMSDAMPVFRNVFGQYISYDGTLLYNVNGYLQDGQGYKIHSIDPSAQVFLLKLKTGESVPTMREKEERTFWQNLFGGARTNNYIYYDMNGHQIDESLYVKPKLDIFRSGTGITVGDYVNPSIPGGAAAVDSSDNAIYDNLGQPIGINKYGQLVDPWGRPLYDNNSMPVFYHNGIYIDSNGLELNLSSANILLDQEGHAIKSAGGNFAGYVLIGSDNQTLIMASSFYNNKFYNMNGTLIDAAEYILPQSISNTPLEGVPSPGFWSSIGNFFKKFGDIVLYSILGILTIFVLIAIFKRIFNK